MSTVSTELTLADLLAEFGPIPVSRIRTTPTPGTATEQDVIDIETHEDRLFELVDGVLVEKVMGYYESFLAMLLGRILGSFADENNLGFVVGESGMTRFAPRLVRMPDVSFVRWDSTPDQRVPRDAITDLIPDLAIEVISRGNTPEEMERKLREYFEAGVRLVWYVYPETSAVRVYNSADQSRELTINDTLDGGEVLPGFELPLKQLFDESKK